MIAELDELASHRVVLFGGKGGVGKTTVSAAAALHYAETRPVILFTTDPASNLEDLDLPLRVEALDADALYARFLSTHLEPILEIGDRGTYLDREELRRLFELTMPGVDELMAWMHIGELAEENPETLIVVDTAPTGHTLRMLSSSEHFHHLALALDAMQEKHRAMVRQFTRREVRDAMDAFIEELDARATRRRALLTDPALTAFVPVTLPEPLVAQQTLRLISELELHVPFVVVNRARGGETLEGQRVVHAPRACVPLDSAERLREWALSGATGSQPVGLGPPHDGLRARRSRENELHIAPLTLLAGKGGVGKTTCSASLALQQATANPDKNYVVISVDPAHSLRDLFESIQPPPNLRVEVIDTKAKWRRFRDSFGEKIVDAVDALTPRGMSLGHDVDAMRSLIEIAPPGADELFAITRLADLLVDETLAGVIVDTAPTGHFLRLLDLPRAAGEWVREFMRLLLRYRDLIPSGSLGEELVRASKELKSVDAALHSERAAVVVVTRPERIVVAETRRLLQNLNERGIRVGGTIANYVTPVGGDACDESMREHELATLATLGDAVTIERRDRPPLAADELLSLVPR
ncbi:MAG TPA: ArsA family ATPase [Thermoanaerobaculia bacterium]|jgi:arsenite-transporting ATPase